VGLSRHFYYDSPNIMTYTPRTEFAQAIKAIATERKLDAEVILETIKQAIVAAYKRDAKEQGDDVEESEFDVELDPISGGAKVFLLDPLKEGEEVPLEKRKKKDVTPPGFGRIAAQTAKQVIHQKIREAEKTSIMDEYEGRIGTLISGMIIRFDGPSVRVDVGRTEAIMPAEERVAAERLSPNQRMTFLLKDISDSPRGKQIVLSRGDPNFVRRLFEREVPEMASKSVEVKGISREAGIRTKMAVFSNQPGVDPVGSCVGQKGVRVQAVTNELGGERVDIIPWSDDTAELIKASLSPADGMVVTLDKKNNSAKVKAPEDQLSLAIGKDGQNARLAAKLTGWKIEIESLEDKEDKKSETDTKKKKPDKKDSDEKIKTKETKIKEKKVKKVKVKDAKAKEENE